MNSGFNKNIGSFSLIPTRAVIEEDYSWINSSNTGHLNDCSFRIDVYYSILELVGNEYGVLL